MISLVGARAFYLRLLRSEAPPLRKRIRLFDDGAIRPPLIEALAAPGAIYGRACAFSPRTTKAEKVRSERWRMHLLFDFARDDYIFEGLVMAASAMMRCGLYFYLRTDH